MIDYFGAELAQALPYCKPTIKTVVVQAKPVIKTIHTGLSYMTVMISIVLSAAVGAAAGWYVRARGMAGMKADLASAQAEIASLKDKADPVAQAA